MGLDQKNPVNIADFANLLAWYDEMGVNDAPFEQSTDWQQAETTIDQNWLKMSKAQPAPAPARISEARIAGVQGSEIKTDTQQGAHPRQQKRPQAPQHTPHRLNPDPALNPQVTIEEATKQAKAANTLADLKNALSNFNGCALKRTAKNLVFFRGAETAKLMVIGEAPGRDEDIVGKPFVGRAGQLLDLMLKAIKIAPEETHITNIVYWRPPGNRTPTPEESSLCRPFLDRQIELVNPDLILFLGGAAAKQMYKTNAGITRIRGKWQKIPGEQHQMDTLATLHPAYLLRTPIAKRLAWQDLQMIREKLEAANGSEN